MALKLDTKEVDKKFYNKIEEENKLGKEYIIKYNN